MIKAAYNFVPLNEEKEYYTPQWHSKVSHDIPFSDSKSGSLKLKIKANTALFIKGDDGKFTHINNIEFIPGTSIKGCIRSVLEILSFGHLNKDRVQNDIFPYRNIDDRTDHNEQHISYMTKMKDVHCGWLFKNNNGGYQIINCGKPGKIRYEKILELVPSTGVSVNDLRNAEDIVAKYNLFDRSYISGRFSEYQLPNKKSYDKRRFYEKGSGKEGTVIFSGAITNKRSEFVIFDNNNGYKNVSESVMNDFGKLNPCCDQIPKNPTRNNGIPVFFTLDNNGNVITIGLSYLHRYYSKNSIIDAIPNSVKGNKPDLADIMFGSTTHNLKGRIQFGHAKKIKGEALLKDGNSIEAVLDSPKASYYPTYIKAWDTWDSEDAVILGRKRYPVKPKYDISPFIPLDENGERNEDTISKLHPLKEGAEFECYIRFHNLNSIELGALLSAITFHGRENECKHSLGQAKALGYGSVSFFIEEIMLEDKGNKEDIKKKFLLQFQSVMNEYIQDWENTKPIKELFAMAKGILDDKLIDTFTPMLLKNAQGKNDFANAKLSYIKRSERLAFFTDILNDSSQITETSTNSRTNQHYQNKSNKRPQNISQQEVENGWKLEYDVELHAYIKENNQISICCPDRYARLKNIYCKYEISDFSREKRIKPEDVVKIKIMEIENDATVLININRIIMKKY